MEQHKENKFDKVNDVKYLVMVLSKRGNGMKGPYKDMVG